MDYVNILYGAGLPRYGSRRKKQTKTKALKDQSFHEVKNNPPERVMETEKRHGKKRAKKQATAIALDKARRKGARIPKK